MIWRIDFLDLAGSPLENVVTMDGRREEGGILIIADAVCIVLGGGQHILVVNISAVYEK